MVSPEGELDDALMDTKALAAGPDSAEVADMALFAEELGTQPSWLGPGTLLAGSFEIEELLGTGGMGVVYRARDLRLGRSVALKLHRRVDQGTERLMREAASMAKLTHPNVATVHEVGTHEGMVFIAMELIDGVTARRWVSQAERSPKQIATLYHAAGQGLAAAHRAGLVHRDFKPENVLVGSDDVPRVVDFGLARLVTEVPLGTTTNPSQLDAHSGSLTVTGAIAGTPAYMAPEQFEGGKVDALADQFSFCVSLYEALYGERPFAGDTMAGLISAIAQGATRPPPAGTRVPARLRRIVLRGLAVEPGDRWPSMEALLEQLHRLVAPPARRWVLAGLAAGGLGIGGGLAMAQASATQGCADARGRLADVWGEERREEVGQAILSTGVAHAPGTQERVEQRLDDYADAWAAKYAEVCEQSTPDEQAVRDRQLQLDCMVERSRSMRAAVDRLAQADAEVVDHAVSLAAGLPGFAWCDDLEALRATVPPPEDPETRREVEALRDALADARAAGEAGKFGPALEQLEPLVSRAEALGYAPMLAEAMAARGSQRGTSGHLQEAEHDLGRAYELAIEHRLDEVEQLAAQELTWVVGHLQARHTEGAAWGGVALAHAKRSGDPRSMGTSLHALGRVLHNRADYSEAHDHYQRALQLLQEALGPDHPQVAGLLGDLGELSLLEGNNDQARHYHEQALQIQKEALGPDHPSLATHLRNLGHVLRELGEYEQARHCHEQALQLSRKALGPDHPEVAMALNELGLLHAALGEYEPALSYFEQSLQILDEVLDDAATARANIADVLQAQGKYEKARDHIEQALEARRESLGDEHPFTIASRINLARVFQAQGEHERAASEYERAIELLEAEYGPDDIRVAGAVNNLGTAHKALGRYEQAQRHYERALRIAEQSLGSEHPQVAFGLNNLGTMLRAQGEYGQAQVYLERALHITEKTMGPDHPEVARCRMNLANVFEGQGEYERAQDHHERALRVFEQSLGPDHPSVASGLNNLGNALRAQGKHAQARAHLERSLRTFEKAMGAEHPYVAHPLVGLANVALAQGDAGTARELAERAVTIREQGETAPELLAEARFVLARALWSDPARRPRARTLAEQARDALATGEVAGNSDIDLAGVERWLAEHPLP